MNRDSLSNFISKWKNKYHKNYSFENAIYINSKTKMTVTCHETDYNGNEHGDFEIRPNDLLMGCGCPICGGTKKLTPKDFEEKANYVHNGFFSYIGDYTNSNSKVTVICPFHGSFTVKANNHLSGQNCKKCSHEHITHKITKLPKINASTKKLDTDAIINRAILMYGNKFTYENLKYTANNKKVAVTCHEIDEFGNEHGDFLITPNHFFSGRGCPKCAGNRNLSTEEFIKLSNKCHNNRYTYFKTEYITTHKNVIVTCPIHGDFSVSPANHLRGEGCPYCNSSHLEKEIEDFLNNIGIYHERQYKFKDDIGNLRYDFYLPKENLLIECQGIQHWENVEVFGGYDGFKQRQKNDKIKLDYAKNKNINILYYTHEKYGDFMGEPLLKNVKDVEEVIKSFD